MHPALLVPEILSMIFKYVTDDSGEPLLLALTSIARTCRPFQREVEGIIWHKIPSILALYNILPPQVRSKESRSWSLVSMRTSHVVADDSRNVQSRRMFAGSDWRRFMERASRVRVIAENRGSGHPHYDRCSTIFLAMAALRDPVLLTPNLQKLEWRSSNLSFNPAINLFISPSLQSLEIDAKLLISNAIRLPLSDICPKLEHLKIIGNARSAADTISSVLCRLHRLETVACSTLDHDAFLHLAQLKRLSYLAVDMRWSVLNLDALRGRLPPGSFHALQTLYWKDYDLDSLADVFLMPDISPSSVHLEIESFCTSPSLRGFLHSFAEKFPHTQDFSLVHDIGASRRFGLQVGPPGREHQLDARDLKPLLALKSLRALNLVDLGNLRLDNDLVRTMASASPELEQLRLGTGAARLTPRFVTFGGLLSLLERCPKLRTVGLCVDAGDMLSFWDTTVRHEHVTHLHLEGSILESRRAEVDEMLRRVLPRLRTVEESLNGVTRRVRDVGTRDSAARAFVEGEPTSGRRTRNSLDSAY